MDNSSPRTLKTWLMATQVQVARHYSHECMIIDQAPKSKRATDDCH